MLPNVDERWFILAVLFLARTAMGFQFQAVAALSSVGDHRSQHRLYTAWIADWTVSLSRDRDCVYPGGLLGQYFGDKRIAVFGMALMVAGGLLSCHRRISRAALVQCCSTCC